MDTSLDLLELRPRVRLASKTVWLLLSALLVWSFALRLWFATPELSSKRFWDERYGLENLEPWLKEGSLRPVHGFHPSLSYLPHGLVLKGSDLLFRATGRQQFAIFDEQGEYTATTYLICRSLQVVVGTVCLVLLFCIGKRLGGEGLGLLAAFLLSVVPWFIRQSVLFKADIVLLTALMLAFYLFLLAVKRPSMRSFAMAGAGIGLALSSKFNAAPIALSLAVGALVGKGSKRRAMGLLALAAAVSVGVFLLLQPFILVDPSIYTGSMDKTVRVYERSGEARGSSHSYVLVHTFASLLSPSFHGSLVGLLGLAGLAAVTVLSIRRLKTSEVAVGWLMAMSFVGVYWLLYAVATPRASQHNYLPISPFLALGAGWSILNGWNLLKVRLPGRLHRPIGAVGAAILVAALGWSANRYVYQNAVPMTRDVALAILKRELSSPPGRLVYAEGDFEISTHRLRLRGSLAVSQQASLIGLSAAKLDLADGEVFLEQHLQEPSAASFYRSRIDRVDPDSVHPVESRWFKAWGPPMVVLTHPLEFVGSEKGAWLRSANDPGLYTAQWSPAFESAELLSIGFGVRRLQVVEVSVAGRSLELIQYRGPWRGRQFVTPPFAPDSPIRLRLNRASGPDRIELVVRQWRLPD